MIDKTLDPVEQETEPTQNETKAEPNKALTSFPIPAELEAQILDHYANYLPQWKQPTRSLWPDSNNRLLLNKVFKRYRSKFNIIETHGFWAVMFYIHAEKEIFQDGARQGWATIKHFTYPSKFRDKIDEVLESDTWEYYQALDELPQDAGDLSDESLTVLQNDFHRVFTATQKRPLSYIRQTKGYYNLKRLAREEPIVRKRLFWQRYFNALLDNDYYMGRLDWQLKKNGGREKTFLTFESALTWKTWSHIAPEVEVEDILEHMAKADAK